MDPKNTFHTPATYGLMRLDYLVAMGVLVALVLRHADEVRWGSFVAAFAAIDLVGYLPGAVWYRTRPRGRRRTPRVYHVLYNTAHSFASSAAAVAVWYLAAGRLEWAMLALPIHLCGDRGVFGNVYKPFGLSFEPASHPAFERFAAAFREAGRW